MEKYLIYSDPHFCKYSSIIRKRGDRYSVRLDNLIKSLSWAEKLADTENCTGVICAGDFFDRAEIDSEEVTALQDVYFSKLPHIMITGNHDSNVANLDFSTLKIFKTIKADVITKPKMITINNVDLYLIPYISGHNKLMLSDYINKNNHKRIIITHNDLSNVRYGRFISESGFDVNNILENCNLFLNGHLHNSYVISDKIVLLGNLTGQNFNEDSYRYNHYAYILTINDDNTIDLDPRVNPYAFNFYKIQINSNEELSKINTVKDNSVVSVVCNSDILKQADDLINKNNKIIEYRLISNYTIDDTETQVDFTVDDHMKQFLNYVQTKIEPSTVLTEELTILGGLDEYKVCKDTPS